MKIKKIFLIGMCLLFFTACSKQEDGIMVKALNFSISDNLYSVEFIAYDFEAQKESYTSYNFEDENYNKAFISAINKYNLNLSLCDYAFINENVIKENKVNQVLNALEEFSVNIDTNLVVSNDISKDNFADINDKNAKITPMYSITNNIQEMNFIIPVLNSDLYTSSAVLINKDGILANLSNEELNIALMLLAGNKNYSYNFENANYSADIKNSFAFYNMEDGILNVNVYIDIKNRNGAGDSETSISAFDTKLKYDIQAKIYGLYTDQLIRNALNLDWVEKQYNDEIIDIQVCVNFVT